MIIYDAEISDSPISAHHVRVYLKKYSVPSKPIGWLREERKNGTSSERVNTVGVPVSNQQICKAVFSFK